MKTYFPLFTLLLMLAGISNTFSQESIKQEAVKSKKERQEVLSKELGLNPEQSLQLLAEQEKYGQQVTRVLRDTSFRGQKRGMELKALSERHQAVLRLLLSPQQREKMAASIRGRRPAEMQAFSQQQELKLPKGKRKGLPTDSIKVPTH